MKFHLPFLVFFPLFYFAQITTDRPGEGTSSDIISPRTFQVESGATYNKINKSFSSDHLFRVGITKIWEVRLETDQNLTDSAESTYGFSSKLKLLESKKNQPSITLIAISDFKFAEYSFILASDKDLTENLSASTNVGYRKEMQDFLFFSFGLEYNLNPKWAVFGEYFGNFNKISSPDHNADFGFTYLATNTLKLDISFGSKLANISDNYFLSSGISFQLN